MGRAVKRTISLPPELARAAEAIAKEQGKTLSGVVQDALREAHGRRMLGELDRIQSFWSRKAKERGILSEADLNRYLAE